MGILNTTETNIRPTRPYIYCNNFNICPTNNDNYLVKLYFVKLFATLSRKLVYFRCGSVPLLCLGASWSHNNNNNNKAHKALLQRDTPVT